MSDYAWARAIEDREREAQRYCSGCEKRYSLLDGPHECPLAQRGERPRALVAVGAGPTRVVGAHRRHPGLLAGLLSSEDYQREMNRLDTWAARYSK
mgnify:CR=1 FL=1